ncbi:peroxiredoxin 1-like protein [Leptotrombidium deliense]|uniref:thioredoxin-dependent peroxiredoxin n=1 Tax=Leptotrombidium deliense TaxID=299467 RepID=A0A443SRX7_9ACAR|nr:peroxiredoxin 1-like protein [Leptotrombidium deliense]
MFPFSFASPPIELTDFIRNAETFQSINSEIIVCSTNSVKRYLAWIKSQKKVTPLAKFKIILLNDKGGLISRGYGVYDEANGLCLRSLFLIDKKSILRHVTLNDSKLDISVDGIRNMICAIEKIALPDVSKQSVPGNEMIRSPLHVPTQIKNESTSKISDNVSQRNVAKLEKQHSSSRNLFDSNEDNGDRMLEQHRPTELSIKKRIEYPTKRPTEYEIEKNKKFQTNKTNNVNANDFYSVQVMESCEIPDNLLNGLKIVIDLTDEQKQEISVFVAGNSKVSFVNLENGKPQILYNDNCLLNFDENKTVMKFHKDEITMKISRQSNEMEINIDGTIINRNIKDNFAYMSVETAADKNHILCVNQRAVFLKAITQQVDETVYDYIELQKAGDKIIYYRRLNE